MASIGTVWMRSLQSLRIKTRTEKQEVGAAVPFGRMGTADDLTGMAIFLASDEAEYIVAQTYNVDGGNWMS
jgi:D-sorbitol dehydrogenase (acceptor)